MDSFLAAPGPVLSRSPPFLFDLRPLDAGRLKKVCPIQTLSLKALLFRQRPVSNTFVESHLATHSISLMLPLCLFQVFASPSFRFGLATKVFAIPDFLDFVVAALQQL